MFLRLTWAEENEKYRSMFLRANLLPERPLNSLNIICVGVSRVGLGVEAKPFQVFSIISPPQLYTMHYIGSYS